MGLQLVDEEHDIIDGPLHRCRRAVAAALMLACMCIIVSTRSMMASVVSPVVSGALTALIHTLLLVQPKPAPGLRTHCQHSGAALPQALLLEPCPQHRSHYCPSVPKALTPATLAPWLVLLQLQLLQPAPGSAAAYATCLQLPQLVPHQAVGVTEGKDALEAVASQEQRVPVLVIRPHLGKGHLAVVKPHGPHLVRLSGLIRELADVVHCSRVQRQGVLYCGVAG